MQPLFTWQEFVDSLRVAYLHHPQLKVVQLAQAIVESGRGTSHLFIAAGNPYGLKWRDGLADDLVGRIYLATPTEPKPVEWCLFRNPETAIRGYWNFINRPVYQGYLRFVDDPFNYLKHIKAKGYATDPLYVSKVHKAFAEARGLLND
jgi:flagellum-specific peptidoglycan hydrolase FlgJ